uniref:Piwi domain-containing protein n=1 Tax=Heterorhabditis bacteriophora TaxID=37862 RepID=A0A1I7WV26_HETBA
MITDRVERLVAKLFGGRPLGLYVYYYRPHVSSHKSTVIYVDPLS